MLAERNVWADLSLSDRLWSVPLLSAPALPTPLSAPSQPLLELEGTGRNTLALSNVWGKLPCEVGKKEELWGESPLRH